MTTWQRIGLSLALFLAAGHAAAQAIQSFGADSLARIEAAHRGKPFVVVMWSLDCAYCGPTFTALVKARQAGVAVETVATDPFDDTEAAAALAHKLDKAGLGGRAWAFDGAAAPEQLRYAVDPKWRGELPRSYWYDAKGNRQAHSGLVSASMVRRFLQATSSAPTRR